MRSESKDREEMARQLRHVAHNIRSHQRLSLGDTEAWICERAAEVLDSSSCAATKPFAWVLVDAHGKRAPWARVWFAEDGMDPNDHPSAIHDRDVVAPFGSAQQGPFRWMPMYAPVPESGAINAAGQEVETGGVSSHGPGPQAVTDEESTVPAPAAPSTPQPEAPTPCKYSGGTCARNYCRQTTRCQAHEALVESYEQRKVSASSAITRSVMIPEEPDEDVVEAILSCLETF